MAKKLIALCACPMGLAHTFMAAQALEDAAVEAGYEVKIETQGADGIDPKSSHRRGYRHGGYHYSRHRHHPGR